MYNVSNAFHKYLFFQTPVLTIKSGVKYSGLITIARYLAGESKHKDLLGNLFFSSTKGFIQFSKIKLNYECEKTIML